MNRSALWTILQSTAVGLVAHVLLGWQFTILGGVVAGFHSSPHHWLNGMLAGALAWMSLVAYNLSVARKPTEVMLTSMGAIFGGLPGWGLLILTICLGALLGAAGVWPGIVLRRLRPRLHS